MRDNLVFREATETQHGPILRAIAAHIEYVEAETESAECHFKALRDDILRVLTEYQICLLVGMAHALHKIADSERASRNSRDL